MTSSDAGSKITVVIPVWNSERWLTNCISALENQTLSGFGVIFVDSASTDSSCDLIERLSPQSEVVALPKNWGFSTAANTGIDRAKTPYIALLNPDTVASPRWLEALADSLEKADDDVAAVAPKIRQMANPDLMEDAGNQLSWYGSAEKVGYNDPVRLHSEEQKIFSPSAAASLYRRSFFLDLKGFDESFESYLEDIDLGLRGRLRGHRFSYQPRAEVLHYGHGSSIGRAHYVRLMTRNRALTFLKSIPNRLLWRHMHQILWGQIYFLLAYRRPLHSLAGYIDLVSHLPRTLRQRKQLANDQRVSSDQIEIWLTDRLAEPTLRRLLASKLKRNIKP